MVHADLLVGTSTADDAGVFRIAPDLALVQTVDFFTPIVDDPFQFGAIAAANALSDVYAMGGEPKTALNVACFPQDVPFEVLTDILRGGLAKAEEAGVVVLGGHTVIDEEIKYGMAVTGLVHPDRILRNVGARPGDALVLTKALGTGIVATALKRGAGSPAEHAAAIESMTALNAAAARVLRGFEVHACTDVTGFGLLGHGYEMAHASGVRLVLVAERLPLLPGARALAAAPAPPRRPRQRRRPRRGDRHRRTPPQRPLGGAALGAARGVQRGCPCGSRSSAQARLVAVPSPRLPCARAWACGGRRRGTPAAPRAGGRAPAAPRRLHLLEAPRPVVLQEAGERAVRQQDAASLAARAVVGLQQRRSAPSNHALNGPWVALR